MRVALVEIRRNDAVAVVTMNRSEKRNALSVALRRELAAALAGLKTDPSVAAAVLTGAPPAFCAGMDRSEFGGDPEHRRALYESTTALFSALLELPIPAVAAVHGPALGGGFVLAACCDVRIASPTATFGHPETRLGIPASYGSLLRVVSEQAARELAFTGRVIGAEEALALGLVREVCDDPVGRAEGLAAEMAALGRPVLESTKHLVAESMAGSRATRAWEAELALFRRVLFGDETR